MHAIIALSEMEMGERAMPVPDMPKNSGLSLALIGNASGKDHGTKEERDPRHFRQETRRKRLAFAADALSYGICMAVWYPVESWKSNGELERMRVDLRQRHK